MIFGIFFAAFISIHYSLDLTQPLHSLSNLLNQHCVHWFSQSLPSSDLSASFICGQKVTHAMDRELLQKSGLYHIIVVSGGHFLFLQVALKRLLIPMPLRILVLLVYYLMTGLQAPGLRCLIHMGLSFLSKHTQLRTSNSALCFYSGLLCLVISFPLWQSLSFWLSFTVSMALCHSQDLSETRSTSAQFILPLVCIYLFLIPFNYTLGYTHPLSSLVGLLLLYPFCFALGTSALILIIFKMTEWEILYYLNCTLNQILFSILKHTTLVIPSKNQGSVAPLFFWLYALFLMILLHFLTLRLRRDTIRG